MSEATAALTGDNGGAETGAATEVPETPWYGNGVSEDTAAFIQNKGWDSPAAAIESYRNLEKFAGGSKNLVELPGADADADTMNAFYGKLGRPETPDAYSFETPDGGDADLVGWFRNTAHSVGLNDTQAKQMLDAWQEMSAGRVESMEVNMREQSEAAINDLKKEMGQGWDKFLNSGRQAAKGLGYSEEELSSLEERMGTEHMMRLFGRIGSKMGEDSFEGGARPGQGSFGLTPAAAQAQIADLKLDSGFMNKYLSGDKDAVAKMTRLNEAAFGG